ncbi:MAG: prolipoprotein diacylglyceryl transferase [Anaerolineae bacterium]|nr:prolipoprotein diacylglyceryl transferase [Anaerolineae bacterium]
MASRYSLCMWLGASAGLAWALWPWRRPILHRLDTCLFLLTLGVLGGRAAHVWADWAYFQSHVLEAIRPRTAGLSYHGGLVGVIIGLAWLVSRRGLTRTLQLGDHLAPPVALASALGWMGCLLIGAAYGQPESAGHSPWLAYWPDLYGQLAWRWPTQALGILLSLSTLGILLFLKKHRLSPGTLLGTYAVVYGIGDWMIQAKRGDNAVMWGGWRAAQWLDVVWALLGALVLALVAHRSWKRVGDGKTTDRCVDRRA